MNLRQRKKQHRIKTAKAYVRNLGTDYNSTYSFLFNPRSPKQDSERIKLRVMWYSEQRFDIDEMVFKQEFQCTWVAEQPHEDADLPLDQIITRQLIDELDQSFNENTPWIPTRIDLTPAEIEAEIGLHNAEA
jgi:hypothetical protein